MLTLPIETTNLENSVLLLGEEAIFKEEILSKYCYIDIDIS